MKGLIQFLVFMWCIPVVYPQQWSWAAEGGIASFIRHNPDIQFPQPKLNTYFEGKLIQHVRHRSWAKYHRYPVLQFALRYHDLGNTEILGHSFSVYPSISLPLRTSPSFPLELVVGSGISFLTRKYDAESNPLQNAIGSHWNNISRIQIQQGFPLHESYLGFLCLGFNHLSNGRVRSPNKGLNSYSIGIGLRPKAKPLSPKPFDTEDSWTYKKWYWDIQAAVGARENKTPGGPTYAVYTLQSGIVWSFDPIQRWQLGIAWEQNMQLADFYTNLWFVENRREALKRSQSWMIYVADEFIFGPCSLTLLAGVYLQSGYQGFPIYNQLSFRYYLSFSEDMAKQLYLSIILKSRRTTAEYIAIGAGYRL